MDELLVIAERFSPHLRDERLAQDMGVTISVLRAWLRLALERRRLGISTIPW